MKNLSIYLIAEFLNIAEMSSAEEYKNNLLNFDLQSFLNDFNGSDIPKLKKLYPGNYKLLYEQLLTYPKAAKKLPGFTSHFCYLTAKSYEQSSSELLAAYKAALFKGNICIDLTGGLGIDDIAFSGSFNKVISVDNDEALNTLAEINFKKLGVNNITRLTTSAEEFIQSKLLSSDLSAELIYIDADRRVNKDGKRSVTFHGSSPDILKIKDNCFKISGEVLLKLSPLTDITYIRKNLTGIKFIKVISLDNEVKEILVLLNKDYKDAALISAVDISSAAGATMEFIPQALESKNAADNSIEFNYLIEPGNAIIKAGLIDSYAEVNTLHRFFVQSPYLLSFTVPVQPFGRVFRIISYSKFSKSAFKQYLVKQNISKASLASRNFPVKPEELKKLFKLSDGGNDYFFFTTDEAKTKWFFHCKKPGP